MYVSHGRPELGGVEVYGDGLILYNLGNFIFHTKTPVGHYEPKAWQSVIADVVVDAKGLKEVVFTPIVLNERGTEDHFLETRGLPQAAIGEEAIEILLRFKELSDAHGTVLHIVGDKARLELRNVSTSH